MAAPNVPPVPHAFPRDLLRIRIEDLCQRALDGCLARLGDDPGFNFAECINNNKARIKGQLAHFQRMPGIDIDVNGSVENFNWNPPAQGGKRTRRTRHRKRFHKKNRTRRQRRVR